MLSRSVVLVVSCSVALPSLSLPLVPFDARSIGMGGTGVASARAAHAPRFNPALLSMSGDDKVGILLPQLGATVVDEEELFDSITDFVDEEYVERFETSIDNIRANVSSITDSANAINTAIDDVNVSGLQSAVNSLTSDAGLLSTETNTLDATANELSINLAGLSNKTVRGKAGGSFGLAIPTDGWSFALTVSSDVDFAGVLNITSNDLSTITDYTGAASSYTDELDEYAQAAGDALLVVQSLDAAITAGDTAAIASLQPQADAAQAAFVAERDDLENFNFGGAATPGDDSDGDRIIFQNGDLAADADEVDFTSTARFVAVNVTEVGITIAKQVSFGDNDDNVWSFGITPKVQNFDIYDYLYRVDDEDDVDFDDVTDAKESESAFNMDIGVARAFGTEGNFRIGAVARNVIKQELDTPLGDKVELDPQVRVGAAYRWGLIDLAADFDVTKNDAIAFGGETQYAMLGAEFNAWNWAQVRLGYRTDMANSGFDSYSVGVGFSPFGVHVDLAAFANTSDTDKEAGASIEFGMSW